jgi:hypothetical protein
MAAMNGEPTRGKEYPGQSGFRGDLAGAIARQHGWCSPYRTLCEGQGISLRDLREAARGGDLLALPALGTDSWKRSRGLFPSLADRTAPGCWMVSSATGGDPSYRWCTPGDLGCAAESFGKAYGEVPDPALLLLLTPPPEGLGEMARRAAIDTEETALWVSVPTRVALARSPGLSFYRPGPDPGMPFTLRFEALVKALRNAEEKGSPVVLAYSVLFIMEALGALHGLSFDFGDRIFVVTGGGGWEGAKGMKGAAPVEKGRYINALEETFGIADPEKQVVDIYGTAELGKFHAGCWNRQAGDFVFTVTPDMVLFLIDPATGEPARDGVQGIPRFISPAGVEGSATAVIEQEGDTMVPVSRAPDGSVREYTRITRSTPPGPPDLGTWLEREWDGCPADLIGMVAKHVLKDARLT